MKSDSPIICGGGWRTRQKFGKPRARRFGFLTLVWMGISFGASAPFWEGWPEEVGAFEWLCVALLVPHTVFAVLAVVFWLTEKPQVFVEETPSFDHDIRKLY
ncbi:hypothetical protein FEM03_21425 [Phragmitibacter flavus]|uniref:Uncharacterized protein n=1 Tax=Phragmitibacter flavus TaxID=2576071 RepID=A0A5R8K8V1_9BACT|nr:hypothetical protein [Phragmitibacter flavus]TLD68743.1 hypothetical protein FEM03_21425 [Phragmitibacter flavus]